MNESNAPPPENLISFDSRQVDLHWLDNRWQMMVGSVVLKDFGRREAEAREALRLVRELHLNQLGTVGAPRPIIEYWLSDGRAPQTVSHGLRTMALDPRSLRAEQIQGQWCLRDDARLLFSFGSRAEDARQALAIMQRYGFSQVGYLGQPQPVMLIFMTDHSALLPAPLPVQPAPLSRPEQPGNPPAAGAPGAGVQPAIYKELNRPGSGNALKPAALPSSGFEPREPGNAKQAGSVAPSAVLPYDKQLAAPSAAVPGASLPSERINFDWRQAQVRHDQQNWKLVIGPYTLASFGASEPDARLALEALQHYRLTEHCLIGQPQPVFSYFLVNGQAPRGLLFGMNGVAFQPETLTVRQQSDGWVITDGQQSLLRFAQAEEAHQVLQVIRKHKCDQLCRIGPDNPLAMTLLLRTR